MANIVPKGYFSANTGTGSATSLAVTTNVTLVAGDMIITNCGSNSGTATNTVTGFTDCPGTAFQGQSTTVDQNNQYRILDGTESYLASGSTITVNNSGTFRISATMVVLPKGSFDPLNPFANASQNTAAASGTITFTGATPTCESAYAITFTTDRNITGANTLTGNSSGFVTGVETCTTNSAFIHAAIQTGHALYDVPLAVATPGTATVTNSANQCKTIVYIRPNIFGAVVPTPEFIKAAPFQTVSSGAITGVTTGYAGIWTVQINNASTTAASGVSNTSGLTWTKQVSQGATFMTEIYTAYASTALTNQTVTVSYGANSSFNVVVETFAGTDTTVGTTATGTALTANITTTRNSSGVVWVNAYGGVWSAGQAVGATNNTLIYDAQDGISTAGNTHGRATSVLSSKGTVFTAGLTAPAGRPSYDMSVLEILAPLPPPQSYTPVILASNQVGPPVLRQRFRFPFWPSASAIASGNAYTQDLTGALSFVGSFVKTTLKALTGSLSFVGSIAKFISHVLTSALSFVGNIQKTTARGISGAVGSAGTIVKSTSNVLSGSLSFVGAISKRVGKALSGALSFNGAIVRFITKTAHTGALSFVGALTKLTSRAQTATLSFNGAFAKGILYVRSLTGSLSFSGAFTKQTNKALSGALSYVGSVFKSCLKVASASLSFSGSITKRISRALTGSLSFVGSFVSGVLYHQSFTGALSFVGSVSKRTSKALTGSLSFVGAIIKMTSHVLSGSVSYAGSIAKSCRKVASASLSFSSSLTKRVSRSLTAAVSFVGSLISGSVLHVALTATLNFSGSIAKRTTKVFSSSLSFSGFLSAVKQAVILIAQAVGVTINADKKDIIANADSNAATIESDDKAPSVNADSSTMVVESDDKDINIENEVT